MNWPWSRERRIRNAASLMGKRGSEARIAAEREAVRKRARELREALNLPPHPGLAA